MTPVSYSAGPASDAKTIAPVARAWKTCCMPVPRLLLCLLQCVKARRSQVTESPRRVPQGIARQAGARHGPPKWHLNGSPSSVHSGGWDARLEHGCARTGGVGRWTPGCYTIAARRREVAPTNIDSPPPRSRPPKPVPPGTPSPEQRRTPSVRRQVPASPVHPLVRAAEQVNTFGSEWWFAGLLIAVFAAAVGRSLCG